MRLAGQLLKYDVLADILYITGSTILILVGIGMS